MGSLVSGFFHVMFLRFIHVGVWTVPISWCIFCGDGGAIWEGLGSGRGVMVGECDRLSKPDMPLLRGQKMVHKWSVIYTTKCSSASKLAYRVIFFLFLFRSSIFPSKGQHSKQFWSMKAAPADPFPVLCFGVGFFEDLSWGNTSEDWISQAVV